MKKLDINIIIIIVLAMGIIAELSIINQINNKKQSENLYSQDLDIIILDNREKPSFYNKTPKEGLKEALEYYDVKYPHIVYAQAILETGNFTSKHCIENNNLFGLYNSKKKKYYKFNHWSESVVAYLGLIQYRYDSNIDYYEFLNKINYAEDPNYTTKLKEIIRNNKLK